MNDEDFKSLQRGLAQAKDYMEGASEGYVVHEPVDVKAIRAASGMTQRDFAAVFHLPYGTVRDWEQQRRTPDAPARVLLHLIRMNPQGVADMLDGESKADASALEA